LEYFCGKMVVYIGGGIPMDIAGMSVVMANSQLRSQASLAVMVNMKNLMQQQGNQLTEMLQKSVGEAPHPTLGKSVDIQV
jgi:Putative motility protein